MISIRRQRNHIWKQTRTKCAVNVCRGRYWRRVYKATDRCAVQSSLNNQKHSIRVWRICAVFTAEPEWYIKEIYFMLFLPPHGMLLFFTISSFCFAVFFGLYFMLDCFFPLNNILQTYSCENSTLPLLAYSTFALFSFQWCTFHSGGFLPRWFFRLNSFHKKIFLPFLHDKFPLYPNRYMRWNCKL